MISNSFRCVMAAVVAVLCSAHQAPAQSCMGDVTGDRVVNAVDLATLLSQWSPNALGASCDLDGNGRVEGVDLGIMLAAWGPCPLPTLTSVTPSNGPAAGGTMITLTGTNLSGVRSVRICGITASSVTVVDFNTVTAITPANVPGSCDVTATAGGGVATLPIAFQYDTPIHVPAWATALDLVPDPEVVVSAAIRDAIRATNMAWRVRDNARGIELVLIPPGAFERGCSSSSGWDCLSDESPVVPLTLTQPLYVGRYEVTQAQWIARYGSNPSFFQGSGSSLDRPVENVSWSNAQAFLSGSGLRLLTEAEWEYAYRAGTTTAYHGNALQPLGSNADTFLDSIAWFDSNNSPYGTKSVGLKPGNGFGLHDMSGNVMEWVSDWYGAEYYAAAPPVNPTGPELGTLRILRGGSWGGSAGFCRSSRRYAVSPSLKNGSIGFRVARNP